MQIPLLNVQKWQNHALIQPLPSLPDVQTVRLLLSIPSLVVALAQLSAAVVSDVSITATEHDYYNGCGLMG